MHHGQLFHLDKIWSFFASKYIQYVAQSSKPLWNMLTCIKTSCWLIALHQMILNVQLLNFLPLSHHFTVLMLQTSNGLLQTCRDVSFFCARPKGGPKRSEGRPFRDLGSRPILSLFLFESRLSMSSRTWRSSPPEMVRKYGRSPGSLVNPKIVCKWMFILRNRLLLEF